MAGEVGAAVGTMLREAGQQLVMGLIRRKQRKNRNLEERRTVRRRILENSAPLISAVFEEYGEDRVRWFDEAAGRTFDHEMANGGGTWEGIDYTLHQLGLVDGKKPKKAGVQQQVQNRHQLKMQALGVLDVYWATIADAVRRIEAEYSVPRGTAALVAAYLAGKAAHDASSLS